MFVVLFSDQIRQPPGQNGWMAAGPEWTDAVLRWVSSFTPDGGTVPLPAFNLVFSQPARPDVIYFLTDGVFTDPSPSYLRKLCGAPPDIWDKAKRFLFGGSDADRGHATVIHTTTLDDASGADICRKIADAVGGNYSHVSS